MQDRRSNTPLRSEGAPSFEAPGGGTDRIQAMFFWKRPRDADGSARRARRDSHFVAGTIRAGARSYDCKVYDLSQTRAFLEIESKTPPELVGTLFLKLASERTHRTVKLLWQHKCQAGIEFVTTWSIAR